MHIAQFLDTLPVWGLFALTSLVTLIEVEIGYRLGRRESRQDVARESVGGLVGASLGLLAFMLAFTFGSAASRHDTRLQLALQDANAIGTAHLRADLLPEAQRIAVQRLLEEYVDLRVEVVATRDIGAIMKGIARSEEMHAAMWRQILAARDTPNAVAWSLATQSLNEVIDIHQERVTFRLHRRVSNAIWLVLYALAGLAMVGAGYHVGLTGRRRPVVVFLTALAFSSVVHLIGDLDRIDGLMTIDQEAMVDLQRSLQR